MQVILLREHTHRRVRHPIGAILNLSDEQALHLIKKSVAKSALEAPIILPHVDEQGNLLTDNLEDNDNGE